MIKELVDDFIRMEDELNLYDKHLKDFPYWIFMRNDIYNNILSFELDRKKPFEKTSISLKSLPKRLIKLVSKEYSVRNIMGNYDLLILCHPRRTYKDGKYYSVYTDPYTDIFHNTLTVEKPYEGRHYTPPYTSNILYLDRLFYYRIAKKYLHRVNLKEYEIEELKSDLNIIKEKISQFSRFDLDEDSISKEILSLYLRYTETKKYFNKLLDKTSPKVVIEIVGYNFENMVLTEVAKSRGIPVIEFQHGLTGRYHLAYNYGKIVDCVNLPNYFFAFSDYWADSMRFGNVQILSNGFAYYESEKNKFKPEAQRNCIVFLSSGSIGEKLSKLAVEISKSKKLSEYKIIYKLHPGEYSTWREKYPWLIGEKITVIDNADMPLYKIFSSSVAQIGVYSTAIFEGLGYNLKTFVLNVEEIEHIEVLLLKGYAQAIDTADELIKGLLSPLQPYDANYFWKENALNNTIMLIKDIIGKEDNRDGTIKSR